MATFCDPERNWGRSSVWRREGQMAACAGDEVPKVQVRVLRRSSHSPRGTGQERDAPDHVSPMASERSSSTSFHTAMDRTDHPHHRALSQGPDVATAAHPGPPSTPFPSSHPQTIPTFPRPLISTLGWEIQSILARSPNFRKVNRVHYTSPDAKVENAIPQVERDGNPLIIAGWNRHPRWPKSLFNIDWLRKNGDQSMSCPSPKMFSQVLTLP